MKHVAANGSGVHDIGDVLVQDLVVYDAVVVVAAVDILVACRVGEVDQEVVAAVDMPDSAAYVAVVVVPGAGKRDHNDLEDRSDEYNNRSDPDNLVVEYPSVDTRAGGSEGFALCVGVSADVGMEAEHCDIDGDSWGGHHSDAVVEAIHSHNGQGEDLEGNWANAVAPGDAMVSIPAM